MCKISVVMPAYNAAQYIEKAIQSVIGQTIKDWELIIVNDASTDNTAEIVRRMAAQDMRIALHENKCNLGVSGTRNRGIELTVGEYIAFLDSDDVWHPLKLEKQLEAIMKFDLCYTSYQRISDKGSYIGKSYIVPTSIDYIGLLKENVIGCSSVLIRAEAIKGLKMDGSFFHEDYVFWLSALRKGIKTVGLSEPLLLYRVGGRSHNKWHSAKNRWIVYRRAEKLSRLQSVKYFLYYCINGMSKTIL